MSSESDFYIVFSLASRKFMNKYSIYVSQIKGESE